MGWNLSEGARNDVSLGDYLPHFGCCHHNHVTDQVTFWMHWFIVKNRTDQELAGQFHTKDDQCKCWGPRPRQLTTYWMSTISGNHVKNTIAGYTTKGIGGCTLMIVTSSHPYRTHKEYKRPNDESTYLTWQALLGRYLQGGIIALVGHLFFFLSVVSWRGGRL